MQHNSAMSGRSNNGSGCDRGRGRGSGGGSPHRKNRNPKSSYNDNKKEMKFAPKVAGKSQGCTYDAVKEHILCETQEKLVNGQDIASNLREGIGKGIREQMTTK